MLQREATTTCPFSGPIFPVETHSARGPKLVNRQATSSLSFTSSSQPSAATPPSPSMTSPNTDTAPSLYTPSLSLPPKTSNGAPVPAIIGGAVGGFAALVVPVTAIALFYTYRRTRLRNNRDKETGETAYGTGAQTAILLGVLQTQGQVQQPWTPDPHM